jgi:hypothetical protein
MRWHESYKEENDDVSAQVPKRGPGLGCPFGDGLRGHTNPDAGSSYTNEGTGPRSGGDTNTCTGPADCDTRAAPQANGHTKTGYPSSKDSKDPGGGEDPDQRALADHETGL